MFWLLVIGAVLFVAVTAIVPLMMRHKYGPEEAQRRFLKQCEDDLSEMGKGLEKEPGKGRWFE